MIADGKKPLGGVAAGLGVDEFQVHFQSNKKSNESALNERTADHLHSIRREPLRKLLGKRTHGGRCSTQGCKIEPKFPVMARLQLEVAAPRLQQTSRIFAHRCLTSYSWREMRAGGCIARTKKSPVQDTPVRGDFKNYKPDSDRQ